MKGVCDWHPGAHSKDARGPEPLFCVRVYVCVCVCMCMCVCVHVRVCGDKRRQGNNWTILLTLCICNHVKFDTRVSKF